MKIFCDFFFVIIIIFLGKKECLKQLNFLGNIVFFCIFFFKFSKFSKYILEKGITVLLLLLLLLLLTPAVSRSEEPPLDS